MSLFFLPTSHPHHGHPFAPAHPSRRCGANALTHSPYDVLRSAPFVVMADEEDEGFFDAQQARYMHQRQQYAHLLRQAELEREREREIHRRRIQRQEEERRLQAAVAAALERQEVERRRRAAAAVAAAQARRQRMEWQARQRQQYLAALEHEQQLRRQHARRRRQAEEQERLAAEQWEELAAKGIASALDFATHFFGALTSEGEKTSQEGAAKTEEQSTAEAAPAEHSTNEEAEQKQSEQAPEYRMDDVQAHDDPADVFPEPEAEQRVEVTAPVETVKGQEREQPIFTLPLPSDPSERAAIKADKIQVMFDENTRSIQLRGLWNSQKNNPPASIDGHSTVGSDSDSDEENSTRGRKRSRSPKRSRVSDVDEKTGEEIEVTEPYAAEKEDEFVHIDKHSQDGTASIPVAQDVSVANLRAELTDDGFHLYL